MPESPEIMEPTLEAYQLAYRQYRYIIVHDSSEPEPMRYYAYNPEFGEHCNTGQGATEEDARYDCDLARLDLIQALLDWGQPVPPPDEKGPRIIMMRTL